MIEEPTWAEVAADVVLELYASWESWCILVLMLVMPLGDGLDMLVKFCSSLMA